MQPLNKTYEAKEVEKRIYQLWQTSGYFNPDNLPKKRKKTYTIVISPPNVTGSLHMGHTLQAIIQDVLIRQKRMQGFKTLWVPGTDHAGIATQNVVEKELKKEGKTRFDLGQAKFVEKVWQWKDKYGDIILNQLQSIGASYDWSRTRFTMDPAYSEAVKTAFLHYYNKGWIYQGERVVNWCPRCQTSLSDLELEYQEEKGKLYYIKYPFKDRPTEFLTVATTRPETMLGDTALAVNPKDKRYQKFVGQTVILPLQERAIPIVADSLVDQKFGTGVVKVTPAHDLTDWEIKENHNLAVIKVIGEKGRMTPAAKTYEGLTSLACRAKVLEDLNERNLIAKVEDHVHALPNCYRCHSLIEPLLSNQWFLQMDHLAKVALQAVKSGKVKILPKNFEKIYFDWLNNIKDWCISRQIWWGHKIPLEVDGKPSLDVLDTWFSSALWPFAVLGFPEKTKDFKTFYPTDVLCTARDIINLWVARMIFSSLEFTKKIPFKVAYIHPTVLAKDGRRMSKSLGTGIDPLELIEKYGADATRFGIVWQLTGIQDMKFSEDSILMGKKFCNKLWNASRFVLGKIDKETLAKKDNRQPIVRKLDRVIKQTNQDIKNFAFGQAARIIYDFFWHDFCDKFLEETKNKDDEKTKETLLYVLLTSLKLLHPFIPFVTEELYQKLPLKNKKPCLMIETWPK